MSDGSPSGSCRCQPQLWWCVEWLVLLTRQYGPSSSTKNTSSGLQAARQRHDVPISQQWHSYNKSSKGVHWQAMQGLLLCCKLANPVMVVCQQQRLACQTRRHRK
jgi:hypothetical protein